VLNLKSLTGSWTKEDGMLRGIVDANATARSIGGNLADQDYEVLATITITSGNASIIVNHTYNESSEECYVEVLLDLTNDAIKLDSVIRNTDGTEKTRTTLASYNLTIETGAVYNVKVVSKEISDDVFAVYGYINGFLVVEKEGLSSEFTIGLHGFECLGSENDYSEFNKVFIQKRTYYTTINTLLNEIRSIAQKELVGQDGTIQDYYDKLDTYILEASRFVDGECQRDQNFFQRGGVELTEYHDGSGSSPPKGMYDFAESEEAWQDRAATIFTGQRPILAFCTSVAALPFIFTSQRECGNKGRALKRAAFAVELGTDSFP